MALSELIKYEGDNTTFIWKYPNEDFNCMAELIVSESQEAIFFANGQASDTFGPGRYKLDAQNIPILTKLVDKVTGVSTFHCQVYFINKAVKMAVRWGTDSKVRFIEPTLGLPIELGACGVMNLEVSDGRKLLIRLVGTMKGISWDEEGKGLTQSVQTSFRPIVSTAVKTTLPAEIRRLGIDVVEIDQYLAELSEAVHKVINPQFEEYGLTVSQFYITTVVLPEEDPNYRRLKDLHTITLQKRMASAEAEVRTSQAESKASYMTAEAEAEAKIKAAQRGAILEGQTTETEIARREAERQLIKAQAVAQAAQLAGMAEASVMQAKGYNQKDVLQAEVQKAYAEGLGNMGSGVSVGGGGSSIMGDMLGMGVGMAAMGAMAPQVGEMMKGFNMGSFAPNNAQGSTAGSTAGNAAGNADSAAAEGMKCAKCGSMLPRNAKFCLECGAKVEVENLSDNEIICPVCGKKTMKGKFCLECGAPLVNKCPNCGAEVPQGGKFCLECGKKLE